MMSLTKAQARAKRAIDDHAALTGRSPTYQELADKMGLASKSAAHRLVEGLVERGHARLRRSNSRVITLLHEPVSKTPCGKPLYFVPIGGES